MPRTSVGPEAVASGPAHLDTPKRRPQRAALLGVLLFVLLGVLSLRLVSDWRLTALREAYLPELQAQSRRDPHNGVLLALLGGRLAEAHDPEAADRLRQAVAAGEGTELVWQTLAATAAVQGDAPRALADLSLGLRSLRTSPLLENALLRARMLGPHPPPALLAQAICPQGPEPLVQAYTRGSALNGVFTWWGRHFPESSGFATREDWARSAPNNPQALRLYGEALVRNGRLADAGAPLRRAVALAPNSPAAHLALADALARGGLPAKAGLEYIAALKLRPDWLPALLGLGRSALNAGLKYAGDAFGRATQIAPQSAEAWIGLGSAGLQFSTDLGRSLGAFREAARLAPVRTDYFSDYASCLQKNGLWQEGEVLLRRRLSAAPDEAQTHYRLAESLVKFQAAPPRLAEAELQAREALRLAPRNPQGEALLGELLLQTGRLPEARDALRLARESDPYNVATLRLLARAEARLGRGAEATALVARAERLFGWNQQINVLENRKSHEFLNAALHRQLVALYAKTGDAPKARQEQTMLALLERDPQHAAQDIAAFRLSLSRIFGKPASGI